MLRLVCDLHASKRNVAVLATAYDWKGPWPDSPLLDPYEYLEYEYTFT